MDSAIEDEVTSINSIYGDEILVLASKEPLIGLLRLPTHVSTILRLEFPNDYPDAPPSIVGTETVGDGLPKGAGNRLLDIVRAVLAEVYRPGEACIYDLLEEAGEKLANDELLTQPDVTERKSEIDTKQVEVEQNLGPAPPWISSELIIEKKSVFVARVAQVNSPVQAQQYLRHLLATDKKVRNATHNINAWRIHGDGGATYQDCDDDGEDAAGGRLLHLMQLMDVWDVMVIVTRWYGGVLLGPDRFRLINSAARDALVKAGYTQESQTSSKKKTKK